MRRVTMLISLSGVLCLLFAPGVAGQLTPHRHAARHALQANEALARSHRYMRGWLGYADPDTGLIPRNLTQDRDIWNARDSAADNYPFMVLTAALTDRALLEGRLLDILRTETRLTSRIDRLPDAWSFSADRWLHAEPDIHRIIFGSSEYVKDGLMPLTEWLGPSPWSQRMVGIVADILKHAPIETRFGRIPSTSPEVNGEMLQVLSRLYWTTGQTTYLEYAVRLGDYYLFDHLPTRESTIRLRDHGCEIIGGLSELYLTVHRAAPEKYEAYRAPIHAMYDRILEVGRNEQGMLYNTVDLVTGRPADARLSDNWGYVYNGFYTVYLVDGTERYRDAVRRALSNVNEHYRDYVWEGAKKPDQPHGSADGYADSIEGAINLFNREPIASAAEWIDSQIRNMFAIQKADGVVEGWHGDGNFARTAIMYALWKTQGTWITPWHEDVRWGAVRNGETVFITIAADAPWQGVLKFDPPRHRVHLNLPVDYPRINQFPEWFTVDADAHYGVSMGNRARRHTADELIKGLPVALTANKLEMNLSVTRMETTTRPGPADVPPAG